MKTVRFLLTMFGVLLLAGVGQAASSSATAGPPPSVAPRDEAAGSKTVNNHPLPVHAPMLASPGSSVKNAGNRSQPMAILGGPAHTTKGTAAINGTGLIRKH